MRSLVFIFVILISSFAFAFGSSDDSAKESKPASQTAYQLGEKAAYDKNYSEAIEHFKKAIGEDSKNADAHNMLAFSYRKSGKLAEAFQHYEIALNLNPNHKGAHEYIGEAYLMDHKLDKAKEHLAKLEKICGKDCPEYLELNEAIAKYKPLELPQKKRK